MLNGPDGSECNPGALKINSELLKVRPYIWRNCDRFFFFAVDGDKINF